jgi:phage portal protein BeeE
LNIIPKFLRRKSVPTNVGTKAENPYTESLATFFGATSGKNVSYTSAMRQQDVYSCIRIKSESIGQLPVKLFSHDGNQKVEITSGVQHSVFTQRPNTYQTWQEFIEMYITTIETIGNFYAEIKRNRYGNVYEIVPFRYQNNCSAEMNASGQVYYTYSTNDGIGGSRSIASKNKSSSSTNASGASTTGSGSKPIEEPGPLTLDTASEPEGSLARPKSGCLSGG